MSILSQQEIKEKINTFLVQKLTEVAETCKCDCYIIGDYVRNLLLGYSPNDKIEIVVTDTDTSFTQSLVKALNDRDSDFAHCVYTIIQTKDKGESIKFMESENNTCTCTPRIIHVQYGSLEHCLDDRTFTIDTVAISLNKEHWGQLIDTYDGLWDLKDGIIATSMKPDKVFAESPVLMLHCVRLATQLNFVIEDETFDAIKNHKDQIKTIKPEEVVDEINKIIMSKVPSKGFVELQRSGVLQMVLPELSNLDCVETRNGKSHKNNFYHTLEVLDSVAAKSQKLELRWAALLHDIGKPRSKRWEPSIGWTFHNHNYLGEKMVKPLFRRLKLPMDERMKYVSKLVGLHMRPIAIADDIVTDSGVRRLQFEAGNDIDDLMLLCEADVTSKNEQRKQNFLHNFQIVRQKLIDLEEKDRIRNFQPPVDGEEIMRMFNLSPCQEVGALKSSLKDAILDGKIPNEREAALSFVLKRAKDMGLHLSQEEDNSNIDAK